MSDSSDDVDTLLTNCPSCGHQLSMHMEEPPDTDELWAREAIKVITNWRFLAGMLFLIVLWLAFNIIFRPFEPHPIFMIATLAATVTTATALQGPLILLTQRRSVERDRQRDRATYQVAANTEHDVHLLREEVRRLTAEISGLSQANDSNAEDS